MKFLILLTVIASMAYGHVYPTVNPFKVIDTIDTINKFILYNPEGPLVPEALKTIWYLRYKTTNETVTKFTKAIMNKTYYTPKFVMLREKLFHYNSEWYREIMERVVYHAYQYKDIEYLVDTFQYEPKELKYISFGALLGVIDATSYVKKINMTSYFKLGSYIKELFFSEYETPYKTPYFTKGEYYGVEMPKNTFVWKSLPLYSYFAKKMPAFVRAPVFNETVCIRNVAYNQYLFATNEYKQLTPPPMPTFPRYRIIDTVTWTPEMYNASKWIMELTMDYKFYLGNYQYAEPFFAASETVDKIRPVYTYFPAPTVKPVPSSRWFLESVFNDVVIKNMDYPSEYLAMRIISQDPLRYEIYLSTFETPTSEALWAIDSC